MKKILLTVAAISFVLLMAACGGSAATTTTSSDAAVAPAAASSTATGSAAAEAANDINRRFLNALVIDEFPYMSAKKPGMVEQVRAIRRGINDALPLVPAGYKIMIIGHNDKNEKTSGVGLQRAQQVFYELRGLGVDASKLATKSVTDTDMVSEENAQHPKQRRVKFKCVQAR